MKNTVEIIMVSQNHSKLNGGVTKCNSSISLKLPTDHLTFGHNKIIFGSPIMGRSLRFGLLPAVNRLNLCLQLEVPHCQTLIRELEDEVSG